MRALLLVCVLLAGVFASARPAMNALADLRPHDPCANAQAVPQELQLPAHLPAGEPLAVERTMLAYLSTYKYRDLGWCVDKGVRDTGPYVNHVMYGTHPAVRVYYSPEMMAWLRGGRRGVPKDGAVIIKEQYGDKPAEYFRGRRDADLKPTDWTIMVRRSSASHDGWFWGEVWVGMFAQPVAKTQYPNAGFGIYCLRCHASAEKAGTFASLENIRGYRGEPLQYYVDESWRTRAPQPGAAANPASSPHAPLAVQTFPPEPLDTYVAHAHVPHMFLTSDQCMGCHSAAAKAPFGPTMWKNGTNLSEYGEWRWSPMGLAGRDPVFYAQFQSELAYISSIHDKRTAAALQSQVAGICSTCHTVMGKRALQLDHVKLAFTPQMVFDANPSHKVFHYAGLARDGISCTVCHHAVRSTPPPGQTQLAYFLNNKINGEFDLGPADQLFGPFKNDAIATHPMNEALGAKPHYSPYVTSAQLCGSCHTINLPVIDRKPITAKPVTHNIEQATYLEWLNSKYQTEYHPLAGAKSCQACHMPEGITDPSRGIALSHIASKIALVEDQSYPATTHAAPQDQITVRYRQSGYRRHELLGLNAFLLAMFKQFPDVMGVRTSDYMSGSTTDLGDAVAHVIQQARTSTAKVNVRARVSGNKLVADVEVVNLTGHRFPSGVAFRRAFLDFEVRNAASPAAPAIFASGRADAHGWLLGGDGQRLATETFERGRDGRQQYQPHYDEAHPITSENQAQIFEELTADASGNFTTSFMRRDHEVKDNRLLPMGWSPKGPTASMPAYFLEATYPKGGAAADPRYRDGKGHAIVRYVVTLPPGVDPKQLRVQATLYYQSFTPYFLQQRTHEAGAASARLAAIVQNLDLTGTPMANWKIRIAQSAAVPAAR